MAEKCVQWFWTDAEEDDAVNAAAVMSGRHNAQKLLSHRLV